MATKAKSKTAAKSGKGKAASTESTSKPAGRGHDLELYRVFTDWLQRERDIKMSPKQVEAVRSNFNQHFKKSDDFKGYKQGLVEAKAAAREEKEAAAAERKAAREERQAAREERRAAREQKQKDRAKAKSGKRSAGKASGKSAAAASTPKGKASKKVSSKKSTKKGSKGKAKSREDF